MNIIEVKQIVKNLIEDIRRIGIKDNIFSFNCENKKIFFYLPYKRDYVQQQLIFKNKFYETNLFNKIKPWISNDFTFLDIGSNIGNHIVYYLKIWGAKKVYGIEPQGDVFTILNRNIQINGLNEQVKLFNIGLGSKDETASIENKPTNNCGATSLITNKDGEVQINKLDSLKIKDKINFIKIDTEGFEKHVLLGGKTLINRDNPIVWVEIDDKNKKFVLDYFKNLNYIKFIKLDQYGNYLFIPKK